MKYEQYISLIQSLEVSASNNKPSYEAKVLMLIVLGYAYFAAIIVSALFPIGLLVGLLIAGSEQILKLLLYTVKLWWVAIPAIGLYFSFIGSAIKSLTTTVPDPEGNEITRTEAPELFEFVGRACKALKASKPARILVTDSFNASVVSIPRIGIFGQRIILILGLPLMKALSKEQLEAVIAHEVGHISGKHGKFSKWAYQMQEAWGRLIESQEGVDHKFGALYKNFVEWFFPYFTAYSFVLMREHEKDADRDAAELVGTRPLAEALMIMETKGRSLQEDFWTEVHSENVANEVPTERIFARMLGALAFSDPDRSAASLAKAFEVPTDFNDTHPALAERLRIIGFWTEGPPPKPPPAFEMDAANIFLGARAERFVSDFEATWKEQLEQGWKDRYEHFQKLAVRIDELETTRAENSASSDELRELARALTELKGSDAAIPVIEETAEKFPELGVVWFNLGMCRLSQNNDEGIRHLEKSIELDSTLRLEANEIIFQYLRSRGRLEEAKQYAGTIDEQYELIENARKERGQPFPGDKWLAHDLPLEFIESIPKNLAGLEEIDAIYAAHKEMKYFPEEPYRVIFVKLRKKGRLRNRNDAAPATVFDVVTKRLNTGEIHYFVLLAAGWAGTEHYLQKIPGSKIYERPT